MKNSRSIMAVMCLALVLLATAAFAGIATTINYQGRLEDSGGPVNGTVSMTFAIYNTPSGGTALWTEVHPDVIVTDGAFSVALGVEAPLTTLLFDEIYYLSVTVGGDAEMSPRAAFQTVPYAARAAFVDSFEEGSITSAEIADGTISGTDIAASAITSNELANNAVTSAKIQNGTITNDDISTEAGIWPTKLVQGHGSFLDADTLDTMQASDFMDKWTYDWDSDSKADLANNSDRIGGYTFDQLMAMLDARYRVRSTITSPGADGEYTSIAIGADGMPIISSGTNGLKVTHCGGATCSSGNTVTEVDSAGDVGYYTSIAIGADDLPIISYYDWTNQALKVLHCNAASCSTTFNIITVDFTGNVGKYSSIAIGSDDLPVISYYDETNGDLKVMHCGDSVCSSSTISIVDSTGDVGWETSIAIGTDNLPVVSYYDNTNDDLKVVHCGDVACSSGNTITTVDSEGYVGRYSAIAIGADDLPIISYEDFTDKAVNVLHCGDASCSSGNTISAVDTEWGWDTSIAIGGDGLPVVSYQDVTNSDLKVVHCGNASCSSGNIISTVDSEGDVGRYASIAIGGDGLPIISYNGYGLKMAHCMDAECTLW